MEVACSKYYRIVLLFYFYFPFSILRKKKKKKVKRTLTFVISLSFIIHIWSMYMVRLRPNSWQKSLFSNISWYSDRWKLKFKFHFTLLSGEFKKKISVRLQRYQSNFFWRDWGESNSGKNSRRAVAFFLVLIHLWKVRP